MDFFDDIDKAIESKMGEDQADSKTEKTETTEQEPTKEASPTDESSIPDLAKLGKFMLDGKEVSYQDLVKERMLQSDYTRKTQELAEQRKQYEEQTKYATNFQADFQSVLQNPALVSEFKKIYPKAYHQAIDVALAKLGSSEQQTRTETPSQESIIEQIVEKRLGPIQSKLDEYETKEATAKLDSIFSEMRTKYPAAEEEFVLARLQTLKDLNVNIDKAKIEEVHKYFNDKIENDRKAYYEAQIKKQSEANRKGKDVSSGGGIPGQAPKKFSMNNTSEIEKAMMEHLSRTQ